MNFQSVKALQPVANVVNEVATALNDKRFSVIKRMNHDFRGREEIER